MSPRSLIVCLPLVALLAIAGCDKPKPAPGQASAGNVGATAASGAGIDNTAVLDRSHKGEAMPAMPFAAPGGAAATLGSFRGHPVLVNLWATWCGPCVEELPTLNELAVRDKAKLVVVAISQDGGGDAQVTPFWTTHGWAALTPYTDAKNALMGKLKVDVLPTTILFDAKGKEVWRVVGGKDWTSPAAATLLAEGE
ncbi:MAG: thioredoxin [Sphingomonas bacterium]|nr:thioredoxin [Sphingomonas bacterium]